MSTVAIITARGGSKRIPKKNIRQFLGKPIIAYSIDAALKSGLFDVVMVSTDDAEIAEIAKSFGADIPFFRSEQNSDDHAGTAEVIIEVLKELEISAKAFDYACCIYPTAPFITPGILQDSFDLLVKKNFTTLFPVCPFSYPIQRSLRFNNEGRVEMNYPEYISMRSQDLPSIYHDAGQFYWLNVAAFKKEQQLFTTNSGAIVLDELQVQDIDNETDWAIAEMKYTLYKKHAEA